eukprot:c19317_g1_i3.p1 GENE.c19317_g1_i3~~c19317_g1_i3.p1  ORF type:complete len:255 (-),score=52.95 c19317_g1_i3:77-841(-)
MDDGAATTRARNQIPIESTTNWCTLITGLSSEESGVMSEDWTLSDTLADDVTAPQLSPITGRGKIPTTLWDVAKTEQPDLSIAVSVSMPWLGMFATNTSVDDIFIAQHDDQAVVDHLAQLITSSDGAPNLMFCELEGLRSAALGSYWGSEAYYAASKMVDTQISDLLGALAAGGALPYTLVIVTGDHGGYGTQHNWPNQASVYVPALLFGAGVRKGAKLAKFVSNLDLAPTALHALGMDTPMFMSGRIVGDAFE